MALTCNGYFGWMLQMVAGLLITTGKRRIFRHYTCNSKKSPCNKITPVPIAARVEFAYFAIDCDFRSKRNKKSIPFHHYTAPMLADARVACELIWIFHRSIFSHTEYIIVLTDEGLWLVAGVVLYCCRSQRLIHSYTYYYTKTNNAIAATYNNYYNNDLSPNRMMKKYRFCDTVKWTVPVIIYYTG